MNGKRRRTYIFNLLSKSEEAISATSLAKRYKVSRQVIVGDIALLRAEGFKIMATPRGYVLDETEKNTYIIAVNHAPDRTEEELQLLINNGVQVVNVMVEHPIYGELVGNLNIKTQQDVENFTSKEGYLLSTLTDGIHLHTIVCDDDDHYQRITKLLSENHLLYDN